MVDGVVNFTNQYAKKGHEPRHEGAGRYAHHVPFDEIQAEGNLLDAIFNAVNALLALGDDDV